MAEIKRQRAGQSFINRPIGVVNVRSGAERKYQAQAELYRGIGQIAFDEAVQMQKKEGQEYAETKLIGRNEDQTVKFEKAPKSLGRYGRAVADEVMEKRYFEAVAVDTDAEYARLREQNLSPERFEGLALEFAQRTAIALEKDGATTLAQRYLDQAEKSIRQNVNSINNEMLKEREAFETGTQLKLWSKTISNARTHASESLDPNTYFNDAISIAEDLLADGRISPSKFAEMLDNTLDAVSKGFIDDISTRVEPRQLKMIANAVRTNKFSDEVKALDPKVAALQQFMSDNPHTDTRTREISAHAASVAGTMADVQRQEAAAAVGSSILQNDRLFGTGTNSSIDKHLRAKMLEMGVNDASDYLQKNASEEAIALNLQQSRYDPALRAAMDAVATGIVTDARAVEEMNRIFQLGRYTQHGYVRDRGLDSKTIDFYEAFNRNLQHLGINGVTEAYTLASKINMRRDEKLSDINDKLDMNESSLDKLADSFSEQYLSKYSQSIRKEMRPSIINVLGSSKSKLEAAEALKETIDQRYTKSDYVYTAGADFRTAFAPERVFANVPAIFETDPLSDEPPFVEVIQKEMDRYRLDGKFGKEWLLSPNPHKMREGSDPFYSWNLVSAEDGRRTAIEINSNLLESIVLRETLLQDYKQARDEERIQVFQKGLGDLEIKTEKLF
jgi:hypothetical protein